MVEGEGQGTCVYVWREMRVDEFYILRGKAQTSTNLTSSSTWLYTRRQTRVYPRPYPGQSNRRGHIPGKNLLVIRNVATFLDTQRDRRSCQFGTHQNPSPPSHLPPCKVTGNKGTETFFRLQIRARQGSRFSGGRGRGRARGKATVSGWDSLASFLLWLAPPRPRAQFASAKVMTRGVARHDRSLFFLLSGPLVPVLNETRFGSLCDSPRTSESPGADPVPK